MAMHLLGYYESVLTAGTLQALTPVPDPTVTESGNLIYVPDKYDQIVYASALTNGTSAFTRAQLQAPSLREMFFPDITELLQGASGTGFRQPDDYSQNPMQLKTNEGLEFFSDGGGDGSTGQGAYGLVWLADGKLSVSSGKVMTVRATAAASLAAGQWVNSALTFDQTLPVGTYDVIGMRAIGANLVASRLQFIGSSAVTRPGVPGVADEQQQGYNHFRKGASGTFGSFDSVTPPSAEFLGITDTSQVVYLDLVKTG